MINTETAQVIHTTVADQSARYPIEFKYDFSPDTLAPELMVTLDGSPLTYGTDYTVDAAGLQLVNAPEAGQILTIKRDVAFTQEIDFQTGLIDPDQIEDGFDRSVMRDQELKRNILDVVAALAAETEERTTADTILQDAIDDEAAARSLADTTLQNNIDAEADAREDADDALQDAIDGKVSKSGDEMSGTLTWGPGQGGIEGHANGIVIGRVPAHQHNLIPTYLFDYSAFVPRETTVQPKDLGTMSSKWNKTYTKTINNGEDITVPALGGTLARIEDVPTQASDVHALPDATKYGASLVLSVDPSTFVVTAQLKDQDNNNIGAAQTIDLPLESVVVSGAYDSATKEVVLTLEGGSTIRFSVADLVSGLQTEITSVNMLDADLVDDTTSTHKFVTATEKASWDSKVSKTGDTIQDIKIKTSGNDGWAITATDSTLTVKQARATNPGQFFFEYNGLSCLNSVSLGSSSRKWGTLYAYYLNNGGTLNIPTSAGTLARLEDLPDVSHMVTDNTAQSITAVKTLVSASASNTTPQVILANYAVKFGTSGNNDLFSISANTNTSTLSIVGDNASNIIDIAASGAVLNHLQVTSSDVTFGGNSLINPGVMTGADGVNAGTSGLVPAPAATDNDKFLSGDGTWKTAGGGSSYTAGTGISIDANNEISVTDPVLVNNSTSGIFRLAVGSGASAAQNTAQAFGTDAKANSNGSLAVGYNVQAQGNYSTAINGSTGAQRAVQLGFGGTNSDANTFKVANANGNFEIMSADGTIPEARLADTTNAAQGQVLALDSNLNAVWQAGGGGGGSSYTAGTGIDITNDVISTQVPMGVVSTYNFTVTTGGTDSLAIGAYARATAAFGSAAQSAAIGNNSYTYGVYSTAIGGSSYAKQYGTAVGANVRANDWSTAVGSSVRAGDNGIALGCGGYTQQTGTANAFDIFMTSDGSTIKQYTMCDNNGQIPTARLTKVNTTATLAVADWSSNTQTVTVSGVKADSVVFVSPDPTSASDYASAGILCTAQAADSLTFTCTTTPSNAITVNVVCM